MQAFYDTRAGALAIDFEEPAGQAIHGDELGDGVIVAVAADGRAVSVEVLDPGTALDEGLGRAAARYELDVEALVAAARSALAAPDRAVTLEVAARAAA
ncbi:MAG: DUF2283 domain-containing protein [Thermoleophilia bacterium]